MAGPGSGRYTNYIPLDTKSAAAYQNRLALFNNKAPTLGDFQTDLVKNAAKILEAGKGDAQMFPAGVDMAYGTSPDLGDVKAGVPGGPGNAFVPDISSPGAVEGSVNVDPKTKTGGNINIADIKPNYTVSSGLGSQDSQNLGSQSPHTTASGIGGSPIGADLIMGVSKGSAESKI